MENLTIFMTNFGTYVLPSSYGKSRKREIEEFYVKNNSQAPC